MPGRVEGKVALITGAARGQGRSHAIRLAEEGASIIAVDLCAPIGSVPYRLATESDLAETVKLVEALDQRAVSFQADVRDYPALDAAVRDGVAELGRLDIVVANAGIFSFGAVEQLTEQAWQDMIAVNLTGVWHTAKAGIPHIRASGGGSIIMTSSTGGLMALPNIGHYVAAKHGVVGLMRTLALELAPDMIRVNSIHPTSVDTDLIHNDATYELFAPHLKNPSKEQIAELFTPMNALPIPWIEPRDVSNAVLWLASDEARYVTGVTLPVDAGSIIK